MGGITVMKIMTITDKCTAIKGGIAILSEIIGGVSRIQLGGQTLKASFCGE
jgi:hypothetical protein